MATPLFTCERCGVPYQWERSPASLKMTYCGSLCEQSALGFSLEALERLRRPTLTEQAESIAAEAWAKTPVQAAVADSTTEPAEANGEPDFVLPESYFGMTP